MAFLEKGFAVWRWSELYIVSMIDVATGLILTSTPLLIDDIMVGRRSARWEGWKEADCVQQELHGGHSLENLKKIHQVTTIAVHWVYAI